VTGPYRKGDIVGLDVKGRQFFARIEEEQGQELKVKPITYNITYFTVKKRDVKAIWRFSKGSQPFIKDRSGGPVWG
jgi:hypothetical protein